MSHVLAFAGIRAQDVVKLRIACYIIHNIYSIDSRCASCSEHQLGPDTRVYNSPIADLQPTCPLSCLDLPWKSNPETVPVPYPEPILPFEVLPPHLQTFQLAQLALCTQHAAQRLLTQSCHSMEKWRQKCGNVASSSGSRKPCAWNLFSQSA